MTNKDKNILKQILKESLIQENQKLHFHDCFIDNKEIVNNKKSVYLDESRLQLWFKQYGFYIDDNIDDILTNFNESENNRFAEHSHSELECFFYSNYFAGEYPTDTLVKMENDIKSCEYVKFVFFDGNAKVRIRFNSDYLIEPN
jgi:hypothetical protein